MDPQRFLHEHARLTRRFLLQAGTGGAAVGLLTRSVSGQDPPARLREAVENLEPYFTPQEEFRDVSRGDPLPHSLDEVRRKEVGLTRDSWTLDVLPDPDNPADLRRPLSRAGGNALTFEGLMEMARQKAVRFPKVMTCLNIGCPLGTGIWEGVPLRDVLWRTEPRRDLRRVFYHGFHNNDPAQMFRSSLPMDRVLEDPPGLPPVILCYKLNGRWLSPERGGPVRIVVPEAYGFKSIKWLTHIFVTNLFHANDTYASGNNDVDSRLKSFAATLSVPESVPAGQPIPVTGYAQVGISGLRGVQAWLHRDEEPLPVEAGDRYYDSAPWRDTTVLPPPLRWGGDLPEDRIPPDTIGFDETGSPRQWPLPLTKVHWAILLPGRPPGDYTLRCRTVDRNGYGQPMPRPYRKSGHAAIEQVSIRVEST